MASLLGQQLGNYRLLQVLGTGGFADVYLGEHIHLGTQAAIKVLQAQLAAQDEQKFRDEARTIARLIHPHIVRVLEFGVEGNLPFLVMDYAPNGNLRDHHAKGTALPLDLVVTYTKQVASALYYAHTEKLIHRDVKPENMLVGRHNEILLSDFGIAVVAHSTRSQKKEDVIGTVDYMAPEQIKAHPVVASDQYALATVVYEWLCGNPPYEGTSTEVLVKHLTVPPPPLRSRVATIPQLVEQVVLKALEKDPEQRFANVLLFASAFEQAGFLHAALTTSFPSISTPIPSAVQTVQEQGFATFPLSTPLQTQPPMRTTPSGVLDEGTLLYTYRGHSDHIYTVAWSSDRRRIASAGADGSMRIWEAISGKEFATFVPTGEAINAVEWSPDGKYIVCGDFSGAIQTWGANGKKISEFKRSHYAVNAVSWSPDGKLIVFGCADGKVVVINPGEGWEYKEYTAPASITALAWSYDGKHIAFACANDKAEVISLARNTIYPDVVGLYSFTKMCTYHGHTDSVNAVAWAHDNKRIASGSEDGTVQIWNVANGERISTYEGHVGAVKTVAWSPDRKRIASAGDDTVVKVWDAGSGNTLFTCQGHADTVRTVAWSLDRKRLASGSEDTNVCVWTH